jgi:hypothetical protein
MRAPSFGTLALALAAVAAACSSSSPGGTGAGGTAGGGHVGTGGTSSTGTGGGAAGTTGAGGSSTTGTGGSSSGAGGTSTGTGGTTVGTGGTTGVAGANGTGGTSATGSGGQAGTGSGGTTGTAGTTGSGGSSAAACPSDATFCSGFEEASGPPVNMPLGTATLEAYTGTFTDLMMLDTQVVHSGKQSLKVLSGAGASAYKMLSVPIPASAFWVHMYIRSDDTFGDMTATHNTFFQAMTSPDPNSSGQVQVAEQWCQVLLNVNDTLYPTGLSSCSTTGPTLSQNMWHCIDAFFDGTNGIVQVYADTVKIIDAENWGPATETYGTFEFGFRQVSGPARNVWYDDVVVGRSRIGCP